MCSGTAPPTTHPPGITDEEPGGHGGQQGTGGDQQHVLAPQPDRLDQTSTSPPSRPSAATLMATPPQVAGVWFGMADSARAATPASHGRGAPLDQAPPAVRRGSAKAATTLMPSPGMRVACRASLQACAQVGSSLSR